MDTNENQGQSTPAGAPQAPMAPRKNTFMGILSYIGIFVLVPFFVAKDDLFVKFHVKQGLLLFIIEAGTWFLSMIMFPLWPLVQVIHLLAIVWSIIGIINVIQGKEKELPLIGSLAKNFNF